MPMLSLCPLSVLPCSPLEQIDAACAAGFDAVGLRLVPTLDTDIDVMADKSLQLAVERRLQATNLEVLDIEIVRIGPETNLTALVPMLEYGRGIGARYLTVTGRIRGARKVCAINRAKQDKLGTTPFRRDRLFGHNTRRSNQKLAGDQRSSHIAHFSADDQCRQTSRFFRRPAAESVEGSRQARLASKRRQTRRCLAHVRFPSNLPRFVEQTLRAPPIV
jgi:hypothetical protein